MIFKKMSLHLFTVLFFSLTLVSAGCTDDDVGDNNDETENPDEEGDDDVAKGCFIELFDGDNFKDDSIKVNGPAEYSDLSDLPDANGMDWTDEADSFKVSKDATVTVWTETNFEGDSTVYDAGNYPSEDEPYSLKIDCTAGDDGEGK